MTVQQAASDVEGSGEILDLLVIGGGINGTGIARDAAGRGMTVLLCEKGDLAQGTSSRSSRLIHGGLRYLEYGEFRLVREALREREILLAVAPHLVRPMRFVLPHVAQMRPAWVLRAGLFLYDHLARRRRLPASSAISLGTVPEGIAVRPELKRGFTYADCRTDDARLVVHNAMAARQLGAQVRTHTEFLHASPQGALWRVQLRDLQSGKVASQLVRTLINAAGPWVEEVAPRIPGVARRHRARLVKGSHLVVPKFWSGDHAYLLQNVDRRAIFVTPYEEDFALIGTTDVPYADSPDKVTISAEETRYLCEAVNRQLRCTLDARDVVHAYSGVRCLVDDDQANATSVSRDYVIDVATSNQHAPVLTVLGGKITTYRRLAEHLLDLLRQHFPGMRPAWTASSPLPGGDFPDADFDRAQAQFLQDTTFLPPNHARALFNRHGTIARQILSGIHRLDGMGRHFGAGLYECEVHHFTQREWALTPQDVLWRRTKIGLRLTPDECRQFTQWMSAAKT